jgi:hypothetical protein
LTVGAVIAGTVSGATVAHGESSGSHEDVQIGLEEWNLLRGFRATFWACFASMSLVVLISLGGLRKAGKVGGKKED